MIGRDDDRRLDGEFPEQRRPGAPRDSVDNLLWQGATRDMTDRIMTRLGYERVDPAARRQAARRRLFARGMTALALAAVAVVGVHVHQLSDRSRAPRGATIDAAMSRGVAEPVDAMEGLSQSVRHLLPSAPRTLDAGEDQMPETRDSDDQSRVPWSGLL